MSECPKCHGMMEDDGTCSCGYGVKRRKAGAEQASKGSLAGQTCAWNDHGRSCQHKGIISSTTNGGGSWYCREHWESINDRVPDVIGNALPAARTTAPRPGISPSLRRELAPLIVWREGETYDEFRRRARAERLAAEPREPGSDDEWADLVPEAAGQA